MKDKASYYMVIPASVWTADIRDKAKLAYGIISVLANKQGYCFATNDYIGKQLGVSGTSASQYISELAKLGFISTVIKYKKNSKEVDERRIYLLNNASVATEDNFNRPTEDNFKGPTEDNFRDNNTSNNNINNNNIDDAKGKVYFKLVELYPKNRVGNRQHGLKKFKQLDIEQCKMALKNVKRYLAVAGSYVKNLQNYIAEECWTEEWLREEERNKKAKDNKNNGSSTANNFSGEY